MPRASSVASAATYDDPLPLQGGPAALGGGATPDLDEDDPLMQVDLSDPLAQQELDAFGTGAVDESLPAPPVDPAQAVALAAQLAAQEGAAAAKGAETPTGGAGAGGKRTLGAAAGGSLEPRAKRPKSVKFSPAKTGRDIARRAAAPGSEVMLPNNDFCDACGGKGHFLCCEGGCLRSFHFQCLEPPLEIDEVPDESWFCKACRAAAHPPPKPPRGYFSDLVYKVETENPKQFSLTNELKTFFKHIASGTSGEFIDSMEHRPPSKITGRAIGQEDRDGFRLKDKNGKSIICYSCDGSAQPQKLRRIISCDFCDQHWHLDCLDPPMTGMPPPTRKWMCPLHAEHLIPKKRSMKTLQPIPVDRRDTPNNGDIVILPARVKLTPEEVEEITVNRIRYQVPEQHVILDFWGRVTEGPRSRRAKPAGSKPRKNRSPRKPSASGYDSGDDSPLTDLTSSDDDDSDTEGSTPNPTASAAALAPPVSAPSALDNLALLAEVRYVDLLNATSSSAANGVASTSASGSKSAAPSASASSSSSSKPRPAAPPPALPASTQRRGPRPSLPLTPGEGSPAVPSPSGGVGGVGAKGTSPSPVPSFPSPAAGASAGAVGAAAAGKSAELTVESKDDLQALMRVRKMMQAVAAAKGAKNAEDEARRATLLGFLEGEPIIPKLGFIKTETSPWTRPWEQQQREAAAASGSKSSASSSAAPASTTAEKPAALSASPASAPAPAAAAAAQPLSSDLSSLNPSSSSAHPSSSAAPTPALDAPAAARPALAPSESPLPFSLPGVAAGKPAPAAAATEDKMEVDEQQAAAAAPFATESNGTA
ncbi:hypothetical protein JCM6882_000278 [Rhodosporidiobolus microsporus]